MRPSRTRPRTRSSTAFREEFGRAVAILIRALGDFDLAEDAVQEAFAVAAERWPRDGVPASPGAWIVTTARNRAIDRLRRERRWRRSRPELARLAELVPEDEEDEAVSTIPDERLRADLHVLPPGARASRRRSRSRCACSAA